MDAPDPPAAPGKRRFSRRTLLRLAGWGAAAGVGAEAARVAFGSNEHTVIPGKVYRSAQLSREKLERVIAEKGVRTVVNLRGCCPETDWYQDDARATHARGVSQEDLTFSAKRYPPTGEVVRLVEVVDRAEYPLLLHCARGADRTGMASAVALLLLTDTTPAVARRQLWPRYGHLPVGRTVRLDEFFDFYDAWLAAGNGPHTPDRFRHWVANDYCPGPFRAALEVVSPVPLAVPAGAGFVVTIRATNTAVAPWEFVTGGGGGVHLRYDLRAPGRPPAAPVYRGRAGQFARTVRPGESVELAAGFPPVGPGHYAVWADLIDAEPIDLLDSSFSQYGSEPLVAGLRVG
ncbi:MAG: hypothetical protein C0501_30355 [Isosphaera sp.]|nr:hypothetical protein [Isosphaera sp.]